MRRYELLVILKPTLTDEEKGAQIASLQETFAKNGAKIEVIEDKGMRTLAYEIQKHKRGHYYVIYFTSEGSSIAEIERVIRFNEDILKFMTVKYENKKEMAFWETLVENVKKSNEKIKNTQENPSEDEEAKEATE